MTATAEDFFSWLSRHDEMRSRPWLILGKGPSFVKLAHHDVSRFETLSLNHVVRERKVTAAHIIDSDVIDDCSEALLVNAGVVVMPWQPHQRNRAGQETLEDLLTHRPILRELAEQRRLLYYNLGTGKRPHPGSAIVPVRFFSGEAALGLLAQAGVRTVRSLGIDGGRSYSAAFADLTDKSLFANGRSTFDRQFEEFPGILMRTGVDYAPLDTDSPIRVFVAATESEMLPVKVLEYSIKRRSSMACEIVPLHTTGIPMPTPSSPANRGRTPFSFQRFLIPEACGGRGRAIYLDADMVVFRDIRHLWLTPMGEADVIAARRSEEDNRDPQFSVMLLNCERLSWSIGSIVNDLDKGRFTYEDVMSLSATGGAVKRDIDPSWNSLERYREGETSLLHYTDMDTQPWVSHANRLGYLWVSELLSAIESGFISRDLVVSHVARGWVRPSLLVQIDQRLADGLLLDRRSRSLDRDFAPPFRTLPAVLATEASLGARAKARARALYVGSHLAWAWRRLRNFRSR